MRKVRSSAPPLTEQVKRRIDKSLADLRAYFASGALGERPEIDRVAYRAYKNALLREFNSKCAFCDRRLTAQLDGDVEHLRPKNGVTDQFGTPIRSTHDPGRNHPGYWWLAYNWQNLVVSCKDCNTRYKRNKFPVEGQYAETEGQSDNGLLIHHHEEEPMDHFKINVVTGELVPLTQKGRVSERILRLNREQLRDERIAQVNKVLAFLAVAVNPQVLDEYRDLAFKTIVRFHAGVEEHSVFCAAHIAEKEDWQASIIDELRAHRAADGADPSLRD